MRALRGTHRGLLLFEELLELLLGRGVELLLRDVGHGCRGRREARREILVLPGGLVGAILIWFRVQAAFTKPKTTVSLSTHAISPGRPPRLSSPMTEVIHIEPAGLGSRLEPIPP